MGTPMVYRREDGHHMSPYYYRFVSTCLFGAASFEQSLHHKTSSFDYRGTNHETGASHAFR